MWEVSKEKLNFELPEGFSLWEDPHRVYLKKGEEIVASFDITPTSPTPEEILKVIAELSRK